MISFRFPALAFGLSLSLCALAPAMAQTPGTDARGDAPLATVSDDSATRDVHPKSRPFTFQMPAARWDERTGTDEWTLAALEALRTHARRLPQMVPGDIGQWCPAYRLADIEQRRAFWVGLISALAWHESTHRPAAVGGGGQWYGLTQIFPSTARAYDCRAKSGGALKDPQDNLSCALRIMSVTVPRDGVISRGMRGVAADWGPFHSSRKRQDMQAWVRQQAYCRGVPRSLKPRARPVNATEVGEDVPTILPTPEARPGDNDTNDAGVSPAPEATEIDAPVSGRPTRDNLSESATEGTREDHPERQNAQTDKAEASDVTTVSPDPPEAE